MKNSMMIMMIMMMILILNDDQRMNTEAEKTGGKQEKRVEYTGRKD